MRFPLLLVTVVLAAAVTVACGPEEGPDLSRFAVVSPAVPPAAGR